MPDHTQRTMEVPKQVRDDIFAVKRRHLDTLCIDAECFARERFGTVFEEATRMRRKLCADLLKEIQEKIDRAATKEDLADIEHRCKIASEIAKLDYYHAKENAIRRGVRVD